MAFDERIGTQTPCGWQSATSPVQARQLQGSYHGRSNAQTEKPTPKAKQSNRTHQLDEGKSRLCLTMHNSLADSDQPRREIRELCLEKRLLWRAKSGFVGSRRQHEVGLGLAAKSSDHQRNPNLHRFVETAGIETGQRGDLRQPIGER